VRKKQILLVVIPLMSWLFLWAGKSAPLDAIRYGEGILPPLEGRNPRKCVFRKTPSDYRALEGPAIYKIQFSSRLVMAILGGAILPQFLVPLIAYDAFYGALGYRIGRADGSANRKHRPTGSRSISRSMASHHLLGCW